MSLSDSSFGPLIRQSSEKLLVVPDRQQVLKVDILFIDDSRLIAFEYLFYDTGRTKYSYQWMSSDNQLIHRWDNAHTVNLSTSPHHQHIGSEENIYPSEPMTLDMVLAFVTGRLSAD